MQNHLLVSGQVQGVGFRVATQNIADALGIVGWVQNLNDGRVEILAEGKTDSLKQLVLWAKQGPNYANVSNVTVETLSAFGKFKDFSIR